MPSIETLLKHCRPGVNGEIYKRRFNCCFFWEFNERLDSVLFVININTFEVSLYFMALIALLLHEFISHCAKDKSNLKIVG